MDASLFTARTGVISALCLIPKAGSALSKLVTALWPDPERDSQKVFKSIEANVRALAEELINKHNTDQLRKQTDGLHRLLVNYTQADPKSEEKTHNFSHLYNSLDQSQPYYLDISTPWINLPYFVTMGTLWLAVLKEELEQYENIYKPPNRNYNQNLKKLRSEIRKFETAAASIREECMRWRLNKIKVVNSKEGFGLVRTHVSTVHDDGEPGWFGRFVDSPSVQGNPYNAHYDVTAACQRRKHYISHIYGAKLDDHLLPCSRWAAFDPTVTIPITASTVSPVTTYDQPIGLGRCSSPMSMFDDCSFSGSRGPITRIVVHAGTRVDAIEVFYGNESSGIHGKVGGTAYDYRLSADEHITQVRGGAGRHLDSFGFSTNLSGPKGPHGGRGGDRFQLGTPKTGRLEHTEPRLHHVWGFVNASGIILQIGFVWATWPMLDLLVQQEQEGLLRQQQQLSSTQSEQKEPVIEQVTPAPSRRQLPTSFFSRFWT